MSTARMAEADRTDPPAEVGARRGARVFCSGDRRLAGRVEGWLTATLEHGEELLISSGWRNPVVRRVPLSDVLRADSRTVLLGIDRQQFLQKPRYLPDDELQQAVFESLRTFTPLRATTIRYTPFSS